MKVTRIFTWSLLLLALPVVFLFAGGTKESTASSGTTTVTVRSYWPNNLYPTWGPSNKQFEAKYPNIKVNFQTPTGGSAESMTAEMLSSNPPDVIMFWHYVFRSYALNGQLVDITPNLKAANMLNGYFYKPAIEWTSPKLNGQYYGLPDFIGPSVYFYNVDLFNKLGLKPPTTLQGLLHVASVLKSHGVIPVAGDWQGSNIMDPLSSIQAQTAGFTPLSDVMTGKATIQNTPSMVQAFDIFDQLVRGGVITPEAVSINQNNAIAGFVSGKIGIFENKANEANAVDKVKPANFHYSYFTIDYVPHPVSPLTSTWGAVWSIPTKSQHHQDAWKYLQWMYSTKWQEANWVSAGQIVAVPAANAALSQPLFRRIAQTELPKLGVNSFYMIDWTPNSVVNELSARLHQLVDGQITTAQVIQDVQSVLNKANGQ